MKNFYLPLSLLVVTVLYSTGILAQPCGIEAKIKIAGGMATCGYFPDTSGYQAGWIGYKYEWKINDEPPFYTNSAPAFMYDRLGAGFNRIQLTVYGTNTNTNDSCVAVYTNIYQATGNAVFPEFDVFVNGNDVTFSGTYKGGPYQGIPSTIEYNFGDGNVSISNSLSESHTYANAGTKLVYLIVAVSDPVTFATVTASYYRSINIGAGATNIEVTNVQDNTLCDSIQLYTSGPIPFTQGFVAENFEVAGNPPLHNAYTHISIAEVPGHDFVRVEGSLPGPGEDGTYHLVEINDCGITPDTISGYVFEDLNYNGLRDPGEPPMTGQQIFVSSACAATSSATVAATYSAYTDTAGYYTILVPHYLAQVNLMLPNGYTLTYPQTNYYAVNFNSGTMHSNYNFGLSALSVHLCGRSYLDDNNDSLYNFTDRDLPGVMLTATNTITGLVYHTVASVNGNYCFDLPPRNFIVKPVNYPLDSATFTPDSLQVNAGGGGNFNNRNFGFRSVVPTDFNLVLTSSTEARPGFDYELCTRVRNTGFLKGKGEIVCDYDPVLTPLSINPLNGIINTANHTITWITDSMSTGAVSYYTAIFNIPVPTPLGAQLNNSSTITALPGTIENDLSDNSYNINQTVIGSYDPNDKAVFPAGIGATGDVLHNTPFDYRIRFQNTGTASAINVFITDTIDENLDLNTLIVQRVSHSYDLVINGNVLTWRFFNINLPDSNTNEPLSHGFIEYSISPEVGLSDGTTIENTAYIYFDFNPPVITNTTLNTMQSSLTAVEEIRPNQQLLVYPNPGRDKITLLPRIETGGRTKISVYDLAGKRIRILFDGVYNAVAPVTADIADLANGIYIIELRHEGGVEKTKWMKQ